jgi:hypothetical protein
MKTIRQISAILIAIVVLIVLLASCREAKANIVTPPTYVFPAIGTLQKVGDTAAGSANQIFLYAWAYATNGNYISIGGSAYGPTGFPSFNNKASMDQYIATQMVSDALYFVVTNTSSNIDKSKGVLINVYCYLAANYTLSKYMFDYIGNIKLLKNPDNSYSVPSLYGFSTVLEDSIPFYIPNLSWARVEVGHNGNQSPSEIDDQFYTNNPIGSDGFLYLSTSDITNSSSSGGNLWMKISLFDNGSFQKFNGDGNPIPETPINLGMTQITKSVSPVNLQLSRNGTNAVVTINGKNPGMAYMLEQSSDLMHWTNSPIYFFSTNTNASAPQLSQPISTGKMFFRVAVINKMAVVTASGGDSGLGFVLQNSTDLKTWNNCSSPAFVSPTNGVPTIFSIPMTNNCSFFRTVTTNLPPTY